MEEAEGKDNGPELRLFCTAFHDILSELAVRPLQVCLQEKRGSSGLRINWRQHGVCKDCLKEMDSSVQ